MNKDNGVLDTESLSESWLAPPIGRIAAPLREQVISALRSGILDLHLKPGQRLVERELVELLGVSRTTIREALRDLISEGLVTVVPQRGAIVSVPSPEEAADLYEIRAVLESLLVRHFVDRVRDDDVARLVVSVEDLEALVAGNAQVREILAAKDRFYEVLLDGARSPTLRQLLGGLKARVQVLRATSLAETGRAEEVAMELRAIADAVTERNAALAAHLTAHHVHKAGDTAMKAIGRDRAGELVRIKN